MILLEGFLVRLMIGITKNPFRRIINVTFLSKRTRLKQNLDVAEFRLHRIWIAQYLDWIWIAQNLDLKIFGFPRI